MSITLPRLRTLAASSILLAWASDARASTTLAWKFRPGDVLRYSTVQTQSMTTKVKEPEVQEFKQGFVLTIDQTWTVKSVDPSGVATLTQSIDRIRTTAELPIGKVTYDSKEAKDAGSPAGPLFKMLVGAEFTFKMSPKGEISDIQAPEKVLATLRVDEPAGAQGQFSEAGLKNMVAQMGLPLPAAPVEPDATWGRKATIPAGPGGETRGIEQTYTYKGPGAEGREMVDLKVAFDPIKPDPAVPVTIKSQESRGSFRLDNAAVRIEASTVVERVELVGTIMGKEINQSGETSTVMTLSTGESK